LEITNLKYSLECQIISNIWIGKAINFIEDGKEFVFSSNEKGILDKVKIEKRVENPEKFYSKITPASKNSTMELTIDHDPAIYEEMMSDLQYLEGYLGFVADLTKIFWNEPEVRYSPETDEERTKLNVFSAHIKRSGYPKSPQRLNVSNLIEIVKGKPKLDILTLLMSFYREGKVFFDRFEYINAFYDFYFILEDLFGRGKTKNKQIESNFKSSIELQEAIKWMLTTVINLNDNHKKEITRLLKEKNLQYNAEGISVLLVKMRRHLHHFSRKSTLKQKPSPLAQQDYESLAFLTMGIAMQSILKEMEKNQKL
jgi:hypothetical protein